MKTYQERMALKKNLMAKKVASATTERGVLILLKGNGKGKSSSAFGTLARTLGYGKKAAVIQFIKANKETGEYKFFREQPQVDWHVMGQGFTWETGNKQQDIAAAKQAWSMAKKLLKDSSFSLIILDEMSYVFKYKYFEIEPVIAALKQRPLNQNVIITGRVMPTELEEIADTISNIKEECHAFRLGVKAQEGIEF